MQEKIASLLVAATMTAGLVFSVPAPVAAAGAPLLGLLDDGPVARVVAAVGVAGPPVGAVRPLLDALGGVVEWEAAVRRVTARRGEAVVQLQVDSRSALHGGQSVGLAVAPRLVSGRTLVPVRFVAEALGARVGYDADSGTVRIDSRGGGPSVGRGEERPPGLQIAATARSYLGTPYVWGGTTPAGFDCSGFTQYIFGRFGRDLPRSSFDQFQSGQAVTRANLKPGDLVFFSTYADGASHVGVYLGEDEFVSAQSSETGVTVRSLTSDYWGSRYLGARRYAG